MPQLSPTPLTKNFTGGGGYEVCHRERNIWDTHGSGDPAALQLPKAASTIALLSGVAMILHQQDMACMCHEIRQISQKLLHNLIK